jgi:hypothetical protein
VDREAPHTPPGFPAGRGRNHGFLSRTLRREFLAPPMPRSSRGACVTKARRPIRTPARRYRMGGRFSGGVCTGPTCRKQASEHTELLRRRRHMGAVPACPTTTQTGLSPRTHPAE